MTTQSPDESGPQTPPSRPGPKRRRTRKSGGLRVAVLIAALVVVGGVSVGILGGRGAAETVDSVPVTEVKQGYLPVEIEERGEIFDMKPLEIMNEVEGWSTVLEVVDQGTIITQEDVDNGMVLVQIDTSELEQEENDRRIEVYEAEADYTQAKEDLDIQLKQNESDVAAAELNIRFARMELDKYLGAELSEHVMENGLDAIDIRQLALEETQLILGKELCRETLGVVCEGPISEDRVPLGGEARQTLRDLSTAVQLAKLELTKARNTLKHSEELAREEYISRSELVRDRLTAQRLEVALETAREELRLFRQFLLPQEAEARFSDYSEYQRDYERVLARTRSELAQREARLKSRERSLALEKSRLERVRRSLEKAVIRAPKPGTVVYGSTKDSRWEDPVSEGSSIQEGKVILRIPDVKSLSVRVNISEKFKDVVEPGQRALVSVEASPNRLLRGRVARISPMASTTHARLNPDEKVYETEIQLLTPPERFIPGMSATARIIVDELEDAIYVPVQAVLKESGMQACWIKTPSGPEPRLVETGYLAGKYLQITSGLEPGEQVYLAPPEERDDEKLAELIAQAEQSRQQPRAMPGPAGAGGQESAGEAGEDADSDAGEPAEASAEMEADAAASEYMDGERPNWRKIGEAMQGLEGEERLAKWKEIRNSLPADVRERLPEQPREGGGRRGGRGGGGGGGRGRRGGQ